MTIAAWCILIAGLLPYTATLIAKLSGQRYNNRDPRGWLQRQQGLSLRANNAQLNSFEAFPLFAAGVLLAQWMQAPQARVDALALIFVAARIAYLICYLADWHWARSLVWLVGIGAAVGLFFTAL